MGEAITLTHESGVRRRGDQQEERRIGHRKSVVNTSYGLKEVYSSTWKFSMAGA